MGGTYNALPDEQFSLLKKKLAVLRQYPHIQTPPPLRKTRSKHLGHQRPEHYPVP